MEIHNYPDFKTMSVADIVSYIENRPRSEWIDLLYKHPDIKDRLTLHETAPFLVKEKRKRVLIEEKEIIIDGFVYLAWDGRFHKIGCSVFPEKRMRQLSQAVEVILIHKIPCENMRETEKQLHYKFKDKLIRGEWYELCEKDVKYIKSL